jgi:hypothetical protein
MLTPEQIRWAASHDWFVADNKDGTIDVRETWLNVNTGGSEQAVYQFLGTIDDLREWAGY